MAHHKYNNHAECNRFINWQNTRSPVSNPCSKSCWYIYVQYCTYLMQKAFLLSMLWTYVRFETPWFWVPDIYSVITSIVIRVTQCNDMEMKWNESGFRPPLCTYRLNWARRTSWGWWDDWDDTVLQTQDSKFEPWRSEAEHATSRSRRLPTILTFTRGWGRNIFVSFKPPRPGTEPRTLAWKAAVLTTTLGPPPFNDMDTSVNEMNGVLGHLCAHIG